MVGGVIAAFALSTSAQAYEPATAVALRERALSDPTAWRLLESLTTEVGQRRVGTPEMVRARDWAKANLEALGFQNVAVEEFSQRTWIRGPESAELTAPYPMKLAVSGLGRSPATPPGGIEAEVVVFKTYAEFLAQPDGALAGKIAMVNQPMARTQDASGYGAAGVMRRQGPVEAAKRGAAAYLVRSLSTSNTALPHAGAAVTAASEWPAIPAAALSVPEADLIERLAARGPVRVRLSMQPRIEEAAPAWNISGELLGSEKPEEVVLIGAHLDSWEGPSAHDDAAGIAITTAAARLIGQLPRYPRRTIRVVMFGSEEMAGSETAYAAAHKDEAIVAASESDGGAERIWRLRLPAGSREHPAMKTAAATLAPLAIFVDAAPATNTGPDMEGLREAGAPVFHLHQDYSRYFDLHHSLDDTLDKIDRAQLSQNVAAWASLVYLIADSDIDFRSLGAPAQ